MELREQIITVCLPEWDNEDACRCEDCLKKATKRADQIHTFYKEAGYVRLAKYQTLPSLYPDRRSVGGTLLDSVSYHEGQQDMLRAHFMAVELVPAPEP